MELEENCTSLSGGEVCFFSVFLHEKRGDMEEFFGGDITRVAQTEFSREKERERGRERFPCGMKRRKKARGGKTWRSRGKEAGQRKSIVRLLIEKWGRFMGYRQTQLLPYSTSSTPFE